MTGKERERPENGRGEGRGASPAGSGARWSLVTWGLTVAGILFALAAVTGPAWSGLLEGWLGYADAYMRMARVEALLDAPSSWFDGRVLRSNAPYGEPLHWTRPLDLVLALPAVALSPVLGSQALIVAAILVPPLILVGTCAAGSWMVRPLLRDLDPPMVALFVFGQPLVVSYGLPGRADHHLLIVLLAVALFGAVVRLFLDQGEAAGRLAGISVGLGLWVSPEALLPYGLATVALGLPWLGRRPARWASRNERVHAWAAGAVVVALLFERPPGDWLALELDRISAIHLVLTSGLAAFWAVVRRLQPATRVGRFGAAVTSALALSTVLVVLRPTFLLGPFGDVDPRLAATWLRYVQELRPLPWSPGRGIAYFGGPVAALLLLPLLMSRMQGRRAALAFLGTALAVTGIMAIREVRWLIYAQVVGAALLAVGASELRAALPDTFRHRLLKAGAVVAGASVWLIGGAVTDSLGPSAGTARVTAQTGPCTSREAVDGLRAAELGGPRTVAAHVDLGPPIVFTTRHAVLAAPYHRNSGVLVVHDALNAVDTVAARRRLASRGAEILLLCEGFDEPFFRREAQGETTLYGRILEGDAPTWLTPVEGAAGGSGVRLYRIQGDGSVEG